MQTYLNNRELLKEIHNSKKSYSYFISDEYADFDAIAPSAKAITPEFAQATFRDLQAKRVNRTTKTHPDQLVFRVMTYEHIPLDGDRATRSRSAAGKGHTRVNFPPFKHYVLRDGQPVEVGRSHWKDGLDNGAFSATHGKMTNKLASMFMMLVRRYADRGNWRGYSYREEMESAALLQLSQVGLMFDESKGSNPFAFYTTTARNCFVRVLNTEKAGQQLRDELLMDAGYMPSWSMQL